MSDTQLRGDAACVQDILARLGTLLHALNLGIDRIENEIDYSYPANVQQLLENREWVILDQDALARAVTETPGPVYYGDLDLCDSGGSWEQTGGPWADFLEKRLSDSGAISQPTGKTLANPDRQLTLQVRSALEGDSTDAERDALVAAAEHLGITWQPPAE